MGLVPRPILDSCVSTLRYAIIDTNALYPLAYSTERCWHELIGSEVSERLSTVGVSDEFINVAEEHLTLFENYAKTVVAKRTLRLVPKQRLELGSLAHNTINNLEMLPTKQQTRMHHLYTRKAAMLSMLSSKAPATDSIDNSIAYTVQLALSWQDEDVQSSNREIDTKRKRPSATDVELANKYLELSSGRSNWKQTGIVTRDYRLKQLIQTAFEAHHQINSTQSKARVWDSHYGYNQYHVLSKQNTEFPKLTI